MAQLELDHLNKAYGSLRALTDLTFSVEAGEIFGFVGSNGAGKTTAMRIVLGVLAADSGEVRWRGRPLDLDMRRRVGYMPEERGLYPKMKVGEQLVYLARLHGMDAPAATAAMERWTERLGVAPRRGDHVEKLSLGNQQRVQLAAALVHDPEVVILDEPATGLDPRGMAEVRDIVRGLKKRNRLIFMSSHILQEVTDVCDEVALIDKGKLLFYDTLANVTSRFGDGHAPIDVGLSRPVDPQAVPRTVGALPGVEACTVLDPTRLRIKFRGDPAAREGLLRALVGLNIGVVSFAQSESLLEEIYLKEISQGDS